MYKELEKLRQNILTSLRLHLIFISILALSLTYILFEQFNDLALALILPAFLAISFYIPIRSKKISTLKKEYEKIIKEVLQRENKDFIYFKEVQDENLIDFNELYIYDKLGFKAHQINFEQIFLCNCTFFENIISSKPKEEKIIFNGVYALFAQDIKYIKYKVDIIDKKSAAKSYFDEVQINDKVFEQNFKVLSQEQNEAKELLNTNLINKILAFKKEVDFDIDLSFFGNSAALYINLGFFMFNFSLHKKIDEDIFKEDILFLRKVLKFIKSLN